jgi:hypothetical protein
VHAYVRRVALSEPCPVGVREDLEVQLVERFEVTALALTQPLREWRAGYQGGGRVGQQVADGMGVGGSGFAGADGRYGEDRGEGGGATIAEQGTAGKRRGVLSEGNSRFVELSMTC